MGRGPGQVEGAGDIRRQGNCTILMLANGNDMISARNVLVAPASSSFNRMLIGLKKYRVSGMEQ
jgi:hypothetical protein